MPAGADVSSSVRVAAAASKTYVGEIVRSSNTRASAPDWIAFTMDATLPFAGRRPLTLPKRLSTRSTYARGASAANHSPSSFDAAYVLRGFGASLSVYGLDALPSNTKSVL